jgi:hypothetical protein
MRLVGSFECFVDIEVWGLMQDMSVVNVQGFYFYISQVLELDEKIINIMRVQICSLCCFVSEVV